MSSDMLARRVLMLIATSSVGFLALMTVFVFREGAPFIARIGLFSFLSADWHPTAGIYGIALMIVGSAVVTLGALLLGVPLGLACAIVLAEMARPRLRALLKPAIEVLAGIPSVVYGFMGIVALLPWIRVHLGGAGASALAGAVILGIMILPTIIGISVDVLCAVPRAYREGALALGATEWQTIVRVVLPAARSGLVAAVILGMGRAVGETMAVIMVAGNSVQMPRSPLDSVRTLTANIALEMGYAAGEHRAALFATGVVLFVIIMALNTAASLARGRKRARSRWRPMSATIERLAAFRAARWAAARGPDGARASARPRKVPPRTVQAAARVLLWSMMAATLLVLLVIVGFVLERGVPHLSWTFLSAAPSDSGRGGGVFPMFVGTLAVTSLAVLLATPLGLGTAIFLTEYTREGRLTRLLRFGAECLAGVPSILFGLFGFVFFVVTLGLGWSILAAGFTLAFMILPTVIRTSEEAIKAVPRVHREVSLSLGASKWQTIVRVVLPSAIPGIVTGILLGVGRSISETAAVIFTAGSSLPRAAPTSLFDGTRTLSVHFYQLAREAISAQNAYATAALLVLSILAIDVAAYALMDRFMRRYR
ncbi:phosphate ABC transporter permease subunit PstC [Sorangium sp. So ce834]|uniref:phosphate ABC transporter permease subunit PstC n=1 Tax=Sorangium sp. So ce834 TaxID=3133321 RepID=UPI003F5F0678